MRGAATYLFIAFLGLSGVPTVRAQQIRVMQWNVHGTIGDIASNTTDAAKALARIVNYNQPDILLFNELNDSDRPHVTAAVIDWVTNNVSYLGSVPSSILGAPSNATFWVAMSSRTDGYERDGIVSRYPVSNEAAYNIGPRGLHTLRVQLDGTNVLQVFQAHLRCCADGCPDSSSCDCTNRQIEAMEDAGSISSLMSSSSLPYIFGGDWNEDEVTGDSHECTITSYYDPITTIKEVGHLVEFMPTTLSGNWRTWSTAGTSPSIRFDYIFAATNRLTPASGYVFSSKDWASHGLYTNVSPQNLVGDSGAASDHYCVFVDYVFPTTNAALSVSPGNGLLSSGVAGGPFSPSNQLYTLSNVGGSALSWTASKGVSWLDLSATSGSLDPGSNTTVLVSLNGNATNLAEGSYSDTVSFSNTTSGVGNSTRSVNLTVNSSNFGFFDDFAMFAPTNLVGQSNWVQVSIASSLPLKITNGQVGIPAKQAPFNNQDAYKNFDQTSGTTYYGLNLTVTNAPSIGVGTNITYFVGMYTATNAAGSDVYRMAAADMSGGKYSLGFRITGNTPYSWGTQTLDYNTPVKVIAAAPAGGTVAYVYVNPTSSDEGSQTGYLTNNVSGSPPSSVGSFVISQNASSATTNDGLTIAKACVGNNFASVYNFLNPPPPVANFSATPTDGTEPLMVTFTDTSTGSITNRFWNFGDTGTTNVTTNSVVHTYSAGTYDVTLIVSGSGGSDTDSQPGYIVALTEFEAWQIHYFTDVNNPLAAPDADPDGDGMNNSQEFQAGTDPTNAASYFHITSVTVQGNSLVLAWATGLGRTNIVQASAGLPGGSYSTNFTNVSSPIILPPGSGATATNFSDFGAATNSPARYYRIRLQP